MHEFEAVEWHENKRLMNIEKHGLDFIDALDVVRGPHLRLEARTVAGEARWQAIGTLDDDRIALIYTVRGPRGSILRPISMRKARDDEKRHYDEVFGS